MCYKVIAKDINTSNICFYVGPLVFPQAIFLRFITNQRLAVYWAGLGMAENIFDTDWLFQVL
jgi:hypothetical protein